MDEAFRKTVIDAASRANPMLARSCPFSSFIDEILKEVEEHRSILVERLVSNSKAPPAMMHANKLLSYIDPPNTDHEPSSDLGKFVFFFTPQSMNDESVGSIDDPSEDDQVAEKLSSVDESEVDNILRDALLEAFEELEKQFGNPCPSPEELLKVKSSAEAAGQASIDATFSKVIEAVLEMLKQSHEESNLLNLVEFAVQAIDVSTADASIKTAVAERLIFCIMPHPEASSGSDVLLKCFWDAILRFQLEISTDIPVDALIAAIERLPADREVKLLFTQIMIESSLRDWVCEDVVEAIGIRMKFKVDLTSEEKA